MSFKALVKSVNELRTELLQSTGRNLVDEVSLEAPSDDNSEAAFIRSVLWGYVLWFEACQPAGRYLMNIVRNVSAEDFKIASRVIQDIQNLRTFTAHNLVPWNRADQYKLAQAKAWLVQNGGAECDWGICAAKLCADLATVLDTVRIHWKRIATSSEDREAAIQGLIDSVDGEWPPHLFDRMVEEAALAVGLLDFDPVAYRDTRIEDWRKMTALFTERASADAALRRAIHQELRFRFGAE